MCACSSTVEQFFFNFWDSQRSVRSKEADSSRGDRRVVTANVDIPRTPEWVATALHDSEWTESSSSLYAIKSDSAEAQQWLERLQRWVCELWMALCGCLSCVDV